MLDDHREIGGTLVGIKVYMGMFEFLVLDGVIDTIKYDLPKSFSLFGGRGSRTPHGACKVICMV